MSMKTISLISVGGFIALVLWALLWPDVVTVETATAARRTLTVTVEEQGRTRARDPFIVASPINGRLLRSAFETGDKVTAGTPLARIAVAPDDRRTQAVSQADFIAAQARRAVAESAVVEAEGSMARARNEEERREELAKTGVTTIEELELYREASGAAEARLLSLRAALQAAEAEVARARSQLLGSMPDAEEGMLTVTSPVDGTIYQIFEESERVVGAGTPLYALSEDDTLEVIVDFITQDAVRIAPDQPMHITGWGGETLNGRVLRVEPQAFTKISALGVEEQRVNVIGSLATLPPGLGTGYRLNAAIVVWQQDDVLTVPSSAVFRRDGHWQVFSVDDGRARLRQLEIGERNSDFVQVLEGIEADTEVILFPSDLIDAGTRVAVMAH